MSLTVPRDTKELLKPSIRRFTAGGTILAGALLAVNAAGKAVHAADAANLRVVGRAEHNAEADETIDVKGGVFAYAIATGDTIGKAQVQLPVFVSDESTVTTAPGNHSVIAGLVYDVDDNGAWVDTRPEAIATGLAQLAADNAASDAEDAADDAADAAGAAATVQTNLTTHIQTVVGTAHPTA